MIQDLLESTNVSVSTLLEKDSALRCRLLRYQVQISSHIPPGKKKKQYEINTHVELVR